MYRGAVPQRLFRDSVGRGIPCRISCRFSGDFCISVNSGVALRRSGLHLIVSDVFSLRDSESQVQVLLKNKEKAEANGVVCRFCNALAFRLSKLPS